jgi:hypothetical protein
LLRARSFDRKPADLRAPGIEENRLLGDLTRKHALGEPRLEHRVKAEATRCFDQSDEHLAVAPERGRDSAFQQQRPLADLERGPDGDLSYYTAI